MKKSICELLLRYYPRISDDEDFYSMYVSNIALNSFLCYTAIMLNIVTINAIRKTPSLPKTLKTLLLSLAVSDVGVGLAIQPFYISLLVKWLQENHPPCRIYMTFDITMGFFSKVSFFNVVTITIDRFLAIHLHLRYQELVTHKRVVAVVISIWLISAFMVSMALWVPPDIRTLFVFVSAAVGFLLTTLAYIRIYLAVRHHKNQIQVMQVQNATQTGEMANSASLFKSAVGTFYVYLVFSICYLPIFIWSAALAIYDPSIALKKYLLYSFTLVFLNSSLNPVIYCWKMRHIRHAVMDKLRNMSWLSNRTSH